MSKAIHKGGNERKKTADRSLTKTPRIQIQTLQNGPTGQANAQHLARHVVNVEN